MHTFIKINDSLYVRTFAEAVTLTSYLNGGDKVDPGRLDGRVKP